jgi:hypothetical protein
VPEATLVLSPEQPATDRLLARTVAYELGLQGIPASVHLGTLPDPCAGRVDVLVDPAAHAATAAGRGLATAPGLARAVVLCPDGTGGVRGDAELALLRRAGAVFVLDQRRVAALHRQGVRARLLRPGYSRSLDRFDAAATRPLDAVCLGSATDRRIRRLADLRDVLSGYASRLDPLPEATAGDGDAEQRLDVLASSKVLVNIHRDEGDTRLEWRDALDAIHAGAVVVSEHSSGLVPLVAGEHLLVASPDALPYVVERLLRDEARLASLRTAAYERLSAWIPFALWVSVLRAAIVELVGEPLPAAGGHE